MRGLLCWSEGIQWWKYDQSGVREWIASIYNCSDRWIEVLGGRFARDGFLLTNIMVEVLEVLVLASVRILVNV